MNEQAQAAEKRINEAYTLLANSIFDAIHQADGACKHEVRAAWTSPKASAEQVHRIEVIADRLEEITSEEVMSRAATDAIRQVARSLRLVSNDMRNP
jgi:hypothetical protein